MKHSGFSLLSIFYLVLITHPLTTHSQFRLPSIFGDHMVLQQESRVAVWGWSDPKDDIVINCSWDRETHSFKSDRSGRWKAFIDTPSAGGPYTITIGFKEGHIFLKDIMTGEVWICSGQSNMEMPVKGYNGQPVLGSNLDILKSANQDIRLITIPHRGNTIPQDDFEGNWVQADPSTVSEFSATAYYFGRLINEILGVPVGLINVSYGGSCVQAWMSKNTAVPFQDWQIPEPGDSITRPNNTPTVLFNGMLNPLIGYGIRGCIWYQGESNRLEPEHYETLFPDMVAEWRQLWNIGEFPFYYVQIAPFDYSASGQPGQTTVNSAYIRDAQRKIMDSIPNSGMAVLMDCGEKNCIHPADKGKAGTRLALWALGRTYGITGISYASPSFSKMEVRDSTAILYFDHAENGLTSFGEKLNNFEMAGKDKIFYPAQAAIKGRTVMVTCSLVPEPVAIRYAFKDFVKGDLFGTSGLPVSSFRTDDW